MKKFLCFFLSLLLCGLCLNAIPQAACTVVVLPFCNTPVASVPGYSWRPSFRLSSASSAPLPAKKRRESPCPEVLPAPHIIDWPVKQSAKREELLKEYSLLHYGNELVEITPRAIVIHWTASDSLAAVHRYFYSEARQDGTLNVGSQFLTSRNGVIYRLTPEIQLTRHSIGYNHCAIGIENTGGVNGRDDLTEAQLTANMR